MCCCTPWSPDPGPAWWSESQQSTETLCSPRSDEGQPPSAPRQCAKATGSHPVFSPCYTYRRSARFSSSELDTGRAFPVPPVPAGKGTPAKMSRTHRRRSHSPRVLRPDDRVRSRTSMSISWAGSVTAHSVSLMSDGYCGTRVLWVIPPGQHRHTTAGPPAGHAWHGAAACLPRSLGTRGPSCFPDRHESGSWAAPVRRRGDTPQISQEPSQPEPAGSTQSPQESKCSRA